MSNQKGLMKFNPTLKASARRSVREHFASIFENSWESPNELGKGSYVLGFGGSISVKFQGSKFVFFSTVLIGITLQMHWNPLLCPTHQHKTIFLSFRTRSRANPWQSGEFMSWSTDHWCQRKYFLWISMGFPSACLWVLWMRMRRGLQV